MVHILWEFEVRSDHVGEFIKHYSSTGTWAQLFKKHAAYQNTQLIQDTDKPLRFITIDVWADLASYQTFKREFAAEYAAIDRTCEGLMSAERSIGIFEVTV